MPRILGPSQTIPGAFDAQTDDGKIIPVDASLAARIASPTQLGGWGASAPIASSGPLPEGTPQQTFGQMAAALGATPNGDASAPAMPRIQPQPPSVQGLDLSGMAGQPAADALAQTRNQQMKTAQARLNGTVGVESQQQQDPAAAVAQSPTKRALEEANLRAGLRQAFQPRGGGGPVVHQSQAYHNVMPGPVSPEQQQAIDAQAEALGKSESAYQEANSKIANIRAQRAEDTADALKGAKDKIETMRAKDVQAQQAYQAKIDAQQTALVEARQKYDSAQVNPEHWWQSRSTGQKVAAAIGMALGAAGAALTHTQNSAAAIIMSAINNDIDAQKTNIGKMGAGVQQQRGVLGDMYRQLGDMRQAEASSRAAAIDQAQLDIQRLSESSKSKEVKANAEALNQQLNLQKQQQMMQAMQAARGTVTVDRVEKRTAGGGGRRALLTDADINAIANNAAKYAGASGANGDAQKEIKSEVKALGQKLVSQGIPAARASLTHIEGLVKDGLPFGAGPVQNYGTRALLATPLRSLAPKKATELIQESRNLLSLIIKQRSGAQATEAEVNRLMQATGLSVNASLQQVQNGIEMMRKELDRNEFALRAGYSDQANKALDAAMNAGQDRDIPESATNVYQLRSE